MNVPSIKIVFDFCCPYCYLAWGFVRKLQQDFTFDVEWMSWEIHPELPLKGLGLAEVMSTDDLQEARCRLNTLGAPVKLTPGDNSFAPNTRLALQGLEFAKEHGKEQEWVDAVYKSHFVEGKNIGEMIILLDIAEQIGLCADKLHTALTVNQYKDILLSHDQICTQNNIEWVPTVFFNDKKILEGMFSYEDFVEAITTLTEVH